MGLSETRVRQDKTVRLEVTDEIARRDEGEMRQRRRGKTVRLEVTDGT